MQHELLSQAHLRAHRVPDHLAVAVIFPDNDAADHQLANHQLADHQLADPAADPAADHPGARNNAASCDLFAEPQPEP